MLPTLQDQLMAERMERADLPGWTAKILSNRGEYVMALRPPFPWGDRKAHYLKLPGLPKDPVTLADMLNEMFEWLAKRAREEQP
jgi:hypothetical protein